MSVQIAAGEIKGSRHVVRTDQGKLYAVFEDGAAVEVWYGGTTGASWAQKDAGNSPSCMADAPVDVDIDSDNRLHIVYVAGAVSAEDLDYVTFDTVDSTAGDDLFNTPEEAISMEDADNGLHGCAVAVDSNDIPHACVLGSDADKGTDYTTLYYDNRIGGAWADRREIEGVSNAKNAAAPDIEINSDNYPVMVYMNRTDTSVVAVEGDANDPTTFATRVVDPSINASAPRFNSICVDSNGDAWIAYVDAGGTIDIAEQSANWTDAWTIVSDGDNGTEPSIVADGTDIYVFYEEDASDDIVYNKYDGSWLGETSLQTSVAYNSVKARWSFLNNPSYDTYGIDYLFDDGTNILWDNLSIAAATALLLLPGNLRGNLQDLRGGLM